MPDVTCSIIIPTIGRKECLEICLQSIAEQSFKDYEIILVTEEGSLAKLRNEGARRAKGKYLVFIDDDVFCSKKWLESIVQTFKKSNDLGGVSGPSLIKSEYRRNRDLFNYKFFKWIYDFFFCGWTRHFPGYFSKEGAWSTRACFECYYEGPVQYLEACNMAFRRDAFNAVKGFDESFLGIGDFSEPDLSFRIRQAGYILWFSRDAILEHRPSKSGAYKKRGKDAPNRMANYELFSSRWIKPCWKHTIFKLFLRTYYATQTIKRLCCN